MVACLFYSIDSDNLYSEVNSSFTVHMVRRVNSYFTQLIISFPFYLKIVNMNIENA
jgi:hypothetical protein